MNDLTEQTTGGWRQASKRRAFLTHLVVSTAIVGAVCTLIFFFWYPQPYFAIRGAWNVLKVLIGVDLILGPLLTLILFRPGKPRLALDMAIIATIQISALLYGTSVIYQERPYYAVFAVDRFEVLARRDVEPSDAAGTRFTSKPLVGPILAFASLPSDPAELQRLLDETLFENKPDIERRPEYWSLYQDSRDDVLARAAKLSDLAAQQPAAADRIRRAALALGEDASALVYVPVIGAGRPLTLVLDSESARPQKVLDINPWGAQTSSSASGR
jgi:hypothetical protein